ncbi:acyltransferase [Duganella sp. sic0402]|uniref:acyltransferase family protein n=1 Tax=Duganella sp. sic0402 TaxID=2854786 RepID=UPI001C479C2C|nr:acyltransferase [Duganella sp. sic0402]MBV7537902.1 acyltransferase [Duganella sp. sic0402]
MNIRPARTLAEAADDRDNGFNLVRLAAAMAVVYIHAYITTGIAPGGDPIGALVHPVSDIGQMALAVFFVISGFFVTRSWMHDPHLARYALRRASRLLPGLAVCVLLSATVAVQFFSSPDAGGLFSGATWRYILGNISLHGLRFNVSGSEWHIDGVLGGQALNGSLWTLFWEGRMYVMVALLGIAAALPLRQWLMGAAAFLLLAAHLFPEVASGYVWEVRLWSMFLVGMLCCTLAPQLRVGVIQVACACVFVALNWTRNASMHASGFTWFGLALLCATVALWAGSRPIRGWTHLRRHDYSYGIYLYNWPVMTMLKAKFPQLTALPMLGVSLLLIVPLAMLSWHYVEAPVLRAARRLLARRAVQAAVTGAPT